MALAKFASSGTGRPSKDEPCCGEPGAGGQIWALGSVTAGWHGRGRRGRRRAVSGDDVVVCWEWTGEGRLYLMVRIGADSSESDHRIRSKVISDSGAK